ncbi:MAG: MgtC/SapB family protein [bacterium]|nr:MgtC/SapB family protein [bacterium]
MLTLEEMILRLIAAVVLGAIVGLERELVGKEAGIRTNILVAAGAAIFTMVGLNLPYLISLSETHLLEVIARNSGFLSIIANIVVGIGFLGAGIIFKEEHRARGLTTAAAVWFTAALGILAGVGLTVFAACAGIGLSVILFLLRNFSIIRREE